MTYFQFRVFLLHVINNLMKISHHFCSNCFVCYFWNATSGISGFDNFELIYSDIYLVYKKTN
jgi:hypothetical protein